jgi:phospholipase C
MALSSQHLRLATRVLSLGRRRATRCFAGVAVAAASLFGAAMPAVAATPPTLVVVILESGGVTSQPAGIACPGKCTATFAAGTSVLLTPEPKNGSTFLRWGGSCTGTGTCRVNVSS